MTAILLFYSPQKHYLPKQLRTLPRSIAYAVLRVQSDMLLSLRKFLRPTRWYQAFDLTGCHKHTAEERRPQLHRGAIIQSNMLGLLKVVNQEVRYPGCPPITHLSQQAS